MDERRATGENTGKGQIVKFEKQQAGEYSDGSRARNHGDNSGHEIGRPRALLRPICDGGGRRSYGASHAGIEGRTR